MHHSIHNLLMKLAVPKRIKLMQLAQQQQSWGDAQVIPYQEQHLQEMIRYCWEYVPFYRSHWQDYITSPEEIQTIADLQKLPILTKAQVRKEYQQLITTQPGAKRSE